MPEQVRARTGWVLGHQMSPVLEQPRAADGKERGAADSQMGTELGGGEPEVITHRQQGRRRCDRTWPQWRLLGGLVECPLPPPDAVHVAEILRWMALRLIQCFGLRHGLIDFRFLRLRI